MLKRIFDIFFSLCLIILLFFPMIIIAILIIYTSSGPAIHWSNRIGRNNTIFQMPKFRTMKLETPDVATHLLSNANLYITRLGNFLRKTSLDELPQLWSILIGHMSFIGYRPALHNQYDLIKLRSDAKIDKYKPGVTGWAQIKGRDMLTIVEKVELEKIYYKNRSIQIDIYILFSTILKIFKIENIKH